MTSGFVRQVIGPAKFKKIGKKITIVWNIYFPFSVGVYVSGILAAVSCSLLGVFCILSIIQIAMISSRDKVVMKYKPLVIIKLILCLAAGNYNYEAFCVHTM